MTKKFVRLLIVLTAITIMTVIGSGAAFAKEIVDEGTCGNNLTWTIDSEGNLSITGSGDMVGYGNVSSLPPWSEHRTAIKTINVEEGA